MYANISLNSIYLYKEKEYNAVKTAVKTPDDVIILKEVGTENEIELTLNEFRNNCKLKKFVRGNYIFI